MALPQTYKVLKSQGLNLDPKIEELPLPKPGKNEVLIKMAFAPLNIIDIGIMYGRFPTAPPPHLVGLEGSGTIVAVGEDLKVPKQVGEKVLVSAANPGGSYRCGTFGEYVLVSAETCPKVPEGVSLEDAASAFINPTTVYYMYELARRGGHKAVIHDVGASQVGRMLIRLLKLRGIKSINIVRKADYIEELKKEGADYVLNSQDADFESKLKEIATKENATISFDAISGSYPALLLKNQPPGSICYVYGVLSGEFTVKDISIGDLFQKKKIAGLVCREHGAERYEKGELQAYFKEIGDLLSTVFKTNILNTFKLEEWKEALDFTRKNNEGKVLFRFE